jgi:hypothetical protein
VALIEAAVLQVRIEVTPDGTIIPLPQKVGRRLLELVTERAFGSVTLHFKAGQLCGVDTVRKERLDEELA